MEQLSLSLDAARQAELHNVARLVGHDVDQLMAGKELTTYPPH